MSIGLVERIDGIFEIMKLTQLMGNFGEDKGDGAADGFFSIGDHTFDWYCKLFQLVLHFGEQSGQIALGTTE